ICDKTTGQLLFYTNGETVWDRTHNAMPNGTGLNGIQFSTQAALIVPIPNDTNLYYIFTAAMEFLSISLGIQYSIVDMSLNGGLGDITVKNSPLLIPGTEKLTGVRHCNGVDYWVISHEWGSDNFYAWLVTNSGITDTIISGVGSAHTGPIWRVKGSIKASPNGKKLAIALFEMAKIEVFDFDNATGIVSNPLTLPGFGYDYALSFSPDNSKLYGATFEWLQPEYSYQFDLQAGNLNDIIASRVALDSSEWHGGMQIAPDGKIYMAFDFSDSLAVINDPNAPGYACNFVKDGFYIGTLASSHGITNFVESFFFDTTKIYGDFTYKIDSCPDLQVAFYGDNGSLLCATFSSWYWDFGDGDTSSLQNPLHQYASSGNYDVTLVVTNDGLYTDTIVKTVNVLIYRYADFINSTICLGFSTEFTDLTNCSPVSWEWEFGDSSAIDTAENPAHLYALTGNYNVTLISTWGDGYTDTITKLITVLTDSGNANFYFEPNCVTEVLFHDSSLGEPANWLWDFGDSTSSTVKDPSHTYSSQDTFNITLIVGYNNGCPPDTITKELFYTPKVTADIPDSGCVGSTLPFNIYFSEDPAYMSGTYWGIGSDIIINESQVNYTFDSAGIYNIWLSVYYNNWQCIESVVDSVIIIPSPSASFSITEDSSCLGNNIFFTDSSLGTPIKWIWDFGDGSAIDTIQNLSHTYSNPGNYDVELMIINSYGCFDTLVKPIVIMVPPLIDAGEDTAICDGSEITLDASGGINYNWSPGMDLSDSTIANPTARPVSTTEYFVTAEDSFGCKGKDSMLVIVYLLPDAGVCCYNTIIKGSSILIIANGGTTYSWTPGNTLSDSTIFNPIASPTNTTTYYVTATDFNGCQKTDSVTIIVIESDSKIVIPNSFSPNGDNINDVFFVRDISDNIDGIFNLDFKIFNRWGELIFESNNINRGWDGTYNGKDVDVGVYTYIVKFITYKLITNSELTVKSGNVTFSFPPFLGQIIYQI
ncbi:PKD domain-containing protein, partial [Candidatus Amoebophilus asiaticus]|nr:PKD domain-containing protein [Candidatus Amoebophilus asiaticus]